ncbi:MAG: response regulator [Phycisphaerales bacterium]|jgi:response regulator NasT|nr:response regulator [Phycisphaerales bacterium]
MTNTPAHNGHDADEQPLPEAPARVLVADDEHLVAAGMVAALTDLGYTVIGPASNGEEAIAHARKERPDLAVLDIRMPGTDGLAAAETIYNELRIPVVMVSAYSDPEYVNSGNRIGVFGYLLKPVNRDQLRVGLEVSWSRFLRHLELAVEVDSLKDRLEQRKIIEQAKWIIVKRKNVEEPEAMRMLQKQARNGRRPLVEVAQAVIESESLLGD